MIHVPPYDSGIDTAPELDKTLRPRVTMGDVLRVPVGSTGVRRALQELQPLVSVHGHVHESGGQSKIGRTTCFNAGSEANQGILRGFVFDLGKDKLERAGWYLSLRLCGSSHRCRLLLPGNDFLKSHHRNATQRW